MSQRASEPTRIGVDVGGTFTDVVLVVDGDRYTAKVPTTADQSVGVLNGIEKACNAAGIDPVAIDAFAHAMTVSVNALLERDGAKTALVTTGGFRDVLEIARQDRPDLYDLDATKPEPLVPRARRFEIDERATTEGIEQSVDPDDVHDLAHEIAATDAESVAVCLLHAYAHPENEQRVAEILCEELDVPVSASHEVLPEFREFERTATTAVDAYVTPAIRGYLTRLTENATDAGVPEPRVMQANGGIADSETVSDHAVSTTLSGPAAGVVGAAATAAETDESAAPSVVTFDMGGTSSDVSLVRDGTAERTTEADIDGIPIRTPMVDVTTVGAGGGSIAWVDSGGALRVGPESAGAEPGPACYGHGGDRPTVTDANVVLGYIGDDTALGGELTLDVEAAHAVLADLADEADLLDVEAAARGVVRVANATMTRAIRSATVERGHDPREFDLVAFGGAGPMHAAALAADLGMDRVVIPAPAGVLSAYGLLAADETHDAVRTVTQSLADSDPEEIDAMYDELIESVLADTSEPEAATIERAADCRYDGQSFELTVAVDEFSPDAVADAFDAAHERAYGYTLSAPVELVNLRVTATIEGSPPAISHDGGGDAVVGSREAIFPTADGDTEARVSATVYDRSKLAAGATIGGPAILEQAESTTVVPPDWQGRIRSDGALVMQRDDDTGGDQ
ncbi:hydantoinase/oxoprolinase family protein [Halonotius terrestris]|uniref:Hydantoinase/oxoprolinase family protein n=1 Tax=Halonotius terrestris TaxID=2487750 RepID=A0A8J8TDT3_9EURY|nr:hydantoinase/oxoprolinase family protein [Halonotius terrestris]TQQ83622.1 hydantoinase/oxoprolinase family protein [Halonotius terrestris]